MARALEEALLDVGIKHVNFFEGRILSGRDLRDQRDADRTQRQHLGQAIGHGVVEGLGVSILTAGNDASSPVLHIEKGLAINRAGQTLLLPHAEDIALIRDRDPVPAGTDLFNNCAAQPAGTELPSGSGLYILTVGPASGFQGEAPRSGLGDGGKGVGCGRRYETVGLRFRLLRFDPATLASVSTAIRNLINNTLIPATSGISSLTDAVTRVRNVSMLRNVVANLLLGPGPLASLALNPGTFGNIASLEPPDPLDDIRGEEDQDLTDCEVPLTILYWTVNGVEFLDEWSVRRVIRQAWDPASLTMRIGCGLERLLQFQVHVAALNTASLTPSGMSIEHYFRFVPPAAFYPAIGAGSPLGMSTTTFLTAFTAGQVSDTSVGMSAEILQRSFLFPAADLQQKPFLQQYSVTENKAAATAGEASQVYVLFVDRSMNGPSVQDGVWEMFSDAWEAYRGLILKRVFLPVGSTNEEAAARVAIVEAVRDVMDLATLSAARGGGWTLNHSGALDAFDRFHGIQNAFATLLSTGVSSIPDTQSRAAFATGLSQRLNSVLPAGGMGLKPAILAANLVNTVRAQDEINRYVGSWSGEGVAVGPFVIDPPASPDGTNLVTGVATAFRHQFRLRNGTDRRLEFQLTARTSAAAGSWDGTTTIHRLDGTAISSMTLDSGASDTFEVRILVPAGAAAGQDATLTVTATAPPPTSRSQSRSVTLPIRTTATAPVTSSVTIEPAFEGDESATGATNDLLNYVFNFMYATVSGPTSEAFDFFIILETTTGDPKTAGWNVGINGGTVDETIVDAANHRATFRKRVPSVRAGANEDVSVIVLVGSSGTVDMRVRVASTTLTPSIENTFATVFDIDVT